MDRDAVRETMSESERLFAVFQRYYSHWKLGNAGNRAVEWVPWGCEQRAPTTDTLNLHPRM